LVENIIKSNIVTAVIGKLKFADDGAYNNNDLFIYRTDNRIYLCIRIRKNTRIKLKTSHIPRNLSVLAQRNDFKKWRDSISYGKRWIAEIVFSSIKRMFDREYLYSVKFENMVKEMVLKASLYNKIISI
jgi:hypothetical protein